MDSLWYLAILLWMDNQLVSNVSLFLAPLKLTVSVPLLPHSLVATRSIGCCTRTLVVGPFAIPATLYWDPHLLCVYLNQRPLPPSANLARSHQTCHLCHPSPKWQSPSIGCWKGLCNSQSDSPGPSQLLPHLGPNQLPDLEILQASLTDLISDPWDQNKDVAKKMHRRTPPWGPRFLEFAIAEGLASLMPCDLPGGH